MAKKKTKGTGDDQGLLGEGRHDVAAGYNDIAGALGDVGHFATEIGKHDPLNIFGIGDSAPEKKKDPKKKAKSDSDKPLTEAQIEAQIAANPFNKLGQGLVTQLEQEQAPIEKAISGGDTASATQSAVGQALAASGVSPGSSAAQWLDSNIAQANANDSPMQAAMNAYGQAYGAGQQGVDQALSGMAGANALGVTTAPEQTWLQGLGTHLQSNLNYYGQIPTSTAENLPPALLYYLQQSGTGGAGGAGVTDLSNLAVPGQRANAPQIPPIPQAAAGATQTSVPSDTGSAPG
jgi:hypothetical protein